MVGFLVGLGVVVVATACSGTPTNERALTSPPSTVSAAHGRPEQGRAGWLNDTRPRRTDRDLLDVITAFWSTYVATSDHSGQFDEPAVRAVIAEVATGISFEQLVTVARTNAAAGLQVRGTVVSHPRVISRTATTATVIDCVDDHTGIYQTSDGTRLDTDDPALHHATFGLVHQRTGWLVAAVDMAEKPCTIE